MSNRTDFEAQAQELCEFVERNDPVDSARLLTAELHNAFVAGQEFPASASSVIERHEAAIAKLRAALAVALDKWQLHSFRSAMVGGPGRSVDRDEIAEFRKLLNAPSLADALAAREINKLR